jgi:hypothetical protein
MLNLIQGPKDYKTAYFNTDKTIATFLERCLPATLSSHSTIIVFYNQELHRSELSIDACDQLLSHDTSEDKCDELFIEALCNLLEYKLNLPKTSSHSLRFNEYLTLDLKTSISSKMVSLLPILIKTPSLEQQTNCNFHQADIYSPMWSLCDELLSNPKAFTDVPTVVGHWSPCIA